MNTTIRPESAGDKAAIHALTAVAFHVMPHSDGSEAQIVERLRASGTLALSLVAENSDLVIVGHIAFSPVTISDGSADWYGLGPVSVIPAVQRTGIGTGWSRPESRNCSDAMREGSSCWAIRIIIVAWVSSTIRRCAITVRHRNISSGGS